MINLPYDRRDAESILAYLEDKALEISGGKWTDFSNGDVGTVLLKLIAYLADMNNYQIDKGLAELYIDTLTERESALSLVKLIGYEPRGYKSARVNIDLSLSPGNSVPDGTIIPAYTQFTDTSKLLSFYNLEDYSWIDNTCTMLVYQGDYKHVSIPSANIDSNSRIYLDEFNIDPETMLMVVAGDKVNRVDNVLTDISNQLAYSVHTSSDSRLYIQLPSYYDDFIPSNSSVELTYLTTSGEDGQIGSYILTRAYDPSVLGFGEKVLLVENVLPSTGASNPETIEEIKEGAPISASTMDTLVTLDDLKLVKHKVPGIADIIALDYNSPESGLIQPDDAYKVNLYVLPKDEDYIVDPNEELTNTGKLLKEYIDKRRLTSITINYKNVQILTPEIKVEAYINRYDLRSGSLADEITNIILDNYSRDNFEIGQGIYSSQLSKQILDKIDYCNYIEVQLPDDSYIPTKMQFLKVQRENIIVTVVEE